jgi:aryl-alcohol dehydrogenase-like predicted oxidoreductase
MEVRGFPKGRPIVGAQADRILNAVLDAGINYIDTSIDYGSSEDYIGKYISHRRSEYYLASKCGCPPVNDATAEEHVYTRENIITGVNRSLRRMKTDYLDAVQLHTSPSLEAIEDGDVVQGLLDLKREGKVRFLACSSWLPNLADHVAMGVFDLFQIPYSGLSRQHEEWITRAAAAGAGTVIRGGVARGEPGEGMGTDEAWSKFGEAGLDELREEGESRTAFMLRFTLSHPDVHTTIVGTRNPDHLLENIRTAERGPLPPGVYEDARRRLAEAGLRPAP